MSISKNSIIWDTSKSDGCMKKTVTNKRLKNILTDFNFTDLKEGLIITYNWFCDNKDTIRK